MLRLRPGLAADERIAAFGQELAAAFRTDTARPQNVVTQNSSVAIEAPTAAAPGVASLSLDAVVGHDALKRDLKLSLVFPHLVPHLFPDAAKRLRVSMARRGPARQ